MIINSALPYEILVHLFSYLTPLELKVCANVCKAWQSASSDNRIWFQHCKLVLNQTVKPIHYQSELNYKLLFNRWKICKFRYQPTLIKEISVNMFKRLHHTQRLSLGAKIGCGIALTLFDTLFIAPISVFQAIDSIGHLKNHPEKMCSCDSCCSERSKILLSFYS
jgi:hypothetical protein